MTIRGVGGHAFTAPRGTAVDTDGKVVLQLSTEPLTTHVVVVSLQWGAENPQPWRDPIANVFWRDLPALQATIWQGGGVGRKLPRALPWLRDCTDAFLPAIEMRSALGLYWADGEHGPRHHFLVATDHAAQLCDRTVALVADAAQPPAPPRHDPPKGGVGGPAVLTNSSRPPRRSVC